MRVVPHGVTRRSRSVVTTKQRVDGICRASAEAVMLCPPLVTTTEQIDEIVATLEAAIADVAADLHGA